MHLWSYGGISSLAWYWFVQNSQEKVLVVLNWQGGKAMVVWEQNESSFCGDREISRWGKCTTNKEGAGLFLGEAAFGLEDFLLIKLVIILTFLRIWTKKRVPQQSRSSKPDLGRDDTSWHMFAADMRYYAEAVWIKNIRLCVKFMLEFTRSTQNWTIWEKSGT